MIKDDKTEDTYQVTWIVLNAVKNMNIGKYKLAEFLKGSKSKDVAHLSNERGFGGLLWYDIATIIGFIEQLEHMKLILRRRVAIDDYYSVLELAEAGKKVLEEKIKIPLQVIKREKPITVGESEKITLDLFSQGKSIPEIAKKRNLALSTIYTHLHRLIVNNYLSGFDVLPGEIIQQVTNVYKQFKNEPKLKEIKEKLPENISYDEIRCVLADLKRNIEINH